MAATSVRQAYAVAHKGIWIDPEHTYPVGIVSVYRRSTGFTLWCGCTGHSVTGGGVDHGAGIRALRAAIDAHHCDDQARLMTADHTHQTTGPDRRLPMVPWPPTARSRGRRPAARAQLRGVRPPAGRRTRALRRRGPPPAVPGPPAADCGPRKHQAAARQMAPCLAPTPGTACGTTRSSTAPAPRPGTCSSRPWGGDRPARCRAPWPPCAPPPGEDRPEQDGTAPRPRGLGAARPQFGRARLEQRRRPRGRDHKGLPPRAHSAAGPAAGRPSGHRATGPCWGSPSASCGQRWCRRTPPLSLPWLL